MRQQTRNYIGMLLVSGDLQYLDDAILYNTIDREPTVKDDASVVAFIEGKHIEDREEIRKKKIELDNIV